MSVRADGRDGSPPGHAWLGDLRPFTRLATAALIIALLYWGQAVLMPVALACLLTFLLSPVASWLDRRGLGRVASVLVVALLAFALMGSAGWLIARQLSTLVAELPSYDTNIRRRIADIRGLGSGGSVEKVQQTVKQVVGEIQKTEQGAAKRDKPLAVVVEPRSPFTVNLPGILQAIGAAGMVAVLVIFMLLERQVLRNRLIRLVGYRWIIATTKALDEAAGRISRYLLMQCLVNGSFGLAVGIGLTLLGVPYAPLWAFLAGALRFIPYIGAWGAALLPIAVSLATSPGLRQPLMVAGLFVALELCTYMGLEPWLYGQSVGLSPVALVVAVIFWAWLWGPVGLLLATPLTVCLIVLGKYLPALGFLVVLMGDEPVLDARARYYQRLLARDQDEASDVVEEYVKENSPESVYDEVLLPALYYTKQDRERENVTDDDVQFALQATREVLDELRQEQGVSPDAGSAPSARVLLCPARDEIDVLALEMTGQLVELDRCRVEILGAAMLTSEMVDRVARDRPDVCCVGAVAPGGLSHTRHLVKRLRARCPDLRLVVGRFGLGDQREEDSPALIGAGADRVATTLLEARHQIAELSLLSGREAEQSGAQMGIGALVSDGAR